jgi:hypothetical protein
MKCPECVKEGKRSQVMPSGSSSTLMYCQPFYDEDGNYHNHDCNVTTTLYRCTEGHEWTEDTTGSCWCGWPKRSEEP